MSDRRRRSSPRSLARSLLIIATLAGVLLAMRQAGWLEPETGGFIAIDGDSLRKGNREYRLNGIDAPELHQICKDASGMDYPCGRDARNALRALVSAKTLACAIIETDRYGRSIAVCKAGERDINAEMVRLGWAIAYRRHSLAYVAAERAARDAGRGIWQGRFDIPEDWRARHRDERVRGGMAADQAMQD